MADVTRNTDGTLERITYRDGDFATEVKPSTRGGVILRTTMPGYGTPDAPGYPHELAADDARRLAHDILDLVGEGG